MQQVSLELKFIYLMKIFKKVIRKNSKNKYNLERDHIYI